MLINMKNRKLFTVTLVLLLMIVMSLPLFADIFYDPDNGILYASTWTFWDTEQPDISIPYLDIWTAIMGMNNTHDIDVARTVLVVFGSVCEYYDYNDYGTKKEIYYPVPAPDASLYSSEIAFVRFD